MQAMKGLMLKVAIVGVALGILLPFGVHAASTQDILHQACDHGATFAGCTNGSQGLDTPDSTTHTTYLQDFLGVFVFAAGTVSVIFLIIGGIRYITSTGDATRIKQAKNTILYAVIGLIIAILALPIAGYVIKTAGG